MTETLKERIARHEGVRLRPYRDSRGILTIGIGRNLQDCGVSEEEADYMLNNDITRIKEEVNKELPWILGLDEARQDVLYEMGFQLGLNGLLGFKNTLSAIRDGRYEEAAKGMLNSQWHYQTPERCEELANIMSTGKE